MKEENGREFGLRQIRERYQRDEDILKREKEGDLEFGKIGKMKEKQRGERRELRRRILNNL